MFPLNTWDDVDTKFWPKVSKTGTCWLWGGTLDESGYGHYQVSNERFTAHRVSYILAYGRVAKELVIDHLCRIKHCVNPDHLEAVTNGENVLRGIGPPAMNAQKTHCIHGHEFNEFNEANTYRGQGRRECRPCHNRRDRERRRIRREVSCTPSS